MPPKLYKGEVKFTYYFLCEEGEEERVSEIVQQDVISNERHTTILESDVVEVDDQSDIIVDDGYLVYGEHEEDITIKEAFKLSTGQEY